MVGESTAFQLGENQLACQGNLETTALRRDEGDLSDTLAIFTNQFLRQPGGLRGIVSDDAKLAFNIHFIFPFRIYQY